MKLKKNLAAFALTLLMCLPIALPRTAAAQTQNWYDVNHNCVSRETINGEEVEIATVVGSTCIIVNLLNVGVSLVGIASFVMVLVGGLMYLTSGGDPRKTEVGSKTLTYAGVGVLVSISGWVIINFLSTFTGVQEIKQLNLQINQ